MANKNWINGKFVDKRNAKYLEQDNFLNESGKVEDINKKLEKEDVSKAVKPSGEEKEVKGEQEEAPKRPVKKRSRASGKVRKVSSKKESKQK